VTTWVNRLCKLAPIAAISLELVKFDLQKMDNAEIRGVEYQQGELAGYEVREYLLMKERHRCAYCGQPDVPLQIEHIIPKSRGGSNRVSNLTIACAPCNRQKGNRTADEFGFPKVQAQAKLPLKDAAAVNSTRWALDAALQATGLPIETGRGGLTKFNRTRRQLPKSHWTDAACVGSCTPAELLTAGVTPLRIKARGHGTRQMCRTDKYGFPRLHKTRCNVYFGFRIGDIGAATRPPGKHRGRHVGRLAVRAKGQFRVGIVDGSGHQHIRKLWSADGYDYSVLKR